MKNFPSVPTISISIFLSIWFLVSKFRQICFENRKVYLLGVARSFLSIMFHLRLATSAAGQLGQMQRMGLVFATSKARFAAASPAPPAESSSKKVAKCEERVYRPMVSIGVASVFIRFISNFKNFGKAYYLSYHGAKYLFEIGREIMELSA